MKTKMVRRPILVANWKLHKTLAETRQFVDELWTQCQDPGAVEVVIAAPFTALTTLQERLQGLPYQLAAQNLFWENRGAYTGEVSAPLLKDVGCSYVIIGHSERRQFFGETDETVNKKVAAAIQAGLRPIVCIGETLAQRQAGEMFAVLEHQVRHGLQSCQAAHLPTMVVAYEPLWAIGTGVTATPAQAQEIHQAIRALLQQLWGVEAAQAVRLQYGGSVRADNITALMAERDIDGALVGGASLDAHSFTQIVRYGSPRP